MVASECCTGLGERVFGSSLKYKIARECKATRALILATAFARVLMKFDPLEKQRAQGRPGERMHPGSPRKNELREAS